MTTVWIIEVQAGGRVGEGRARWYPLLSLGFFNYKRQAVAERKKNVMAGVALRVAKYWREEFERRRAAAMGIPLRWRKFR